ncbi:MAG: hypothetical protein HY342_11500 [Candidatus Lambdaproteobacteria bacterium]|nr:hypothetical protein [Candidatus Lambdaproteobacteria bacterium]
MNTNGVRGFRRPNPRRGRLAALALLLVALTPGCILVDDDLGDSPSLSGIWSGTAQELTSDNTGNITLTISHNGSQLSGNWSVNFPISETVNGGSLTGEINIATNGASFNLNALICPLTATAVFAGFTAEGNYASYGDCDPPQTGSFSVTRQ